MFWTLLRKELAEQVLSGRLLIALALFLILLPLSSILLLEQRERQLEEIKTYEDDQREFTQSLAEQADPNRRYGRYAARGVMVTRRPPPLSFVAQGLDADLPRLIHAVTKGGQYQMTPLDTDKPTSVELDNPILEIFPVADTVYMVAVIGALLAIFVSFDSLCSEREEGTLKLLFANPVRRATVVLAKWIAAVLTVGLGLVTATLVVILYVEVSGKLAVDAELLWRWGAMTAVALLYLAFFCGLGVLVSTVTSSRRVALLVGLAVWLLLVLVAPGTVAAAVEGAVALPQRPHVRILWQEYSDGIRGQRGAPLLDYLRDLVPEEEEKLRLISTYERKAEKQRRLFEVISRVTPAASYIYASAELADTGVSHYDAFRRADQRLADDFRAYLMAHRPEARADQLKPEDVEMGTLPSFSGMSASRRAGLVSAAKDIAALLLETVAALMTSILLFVRTAEL